MVIASNSEEESEVEMCFIELQSRVYCSRFKRNYFLYKNWQVLFVMYFV